MPDRGAETDGAPMRPTESISHSDARVDNLSLLERVLTWPVTGQPAQSPLRLVAAAGAVTIAIAHIPLIEEELSEAAYVGVGFVLLSIAGLLLTHRLLSADTTAVWIASLVVAAVALAAFVISRTIGLPDLGDDIGNWSEPLGIVALVGEGVLVGASAVHLGTAPRHRSLHR